MPNQIRIEGNLGKDSELRYTPNGRPVLVYSIAADQQSKKNEQGQWEQTGPTLWLDCELWGDEAERVHEKAVKGARLVTFGHLKCETWDDKQTGEKRFKTKVAVDAVKVLPPRNQQQGGIQGGQSRPQQGQQQDDPWGSTPGQQQGFGQADDEPPF